MIVCMYAFAQDDQRIWSRLYKIVLEKVTFFFGFIINRIEKEVEKTSEDD